MPKSKVRKSRKKKIQRIRPKIKTVRSSLSELKEGDKAMLQRDLHRILNLIKERKKYLKESPEYSSISCKIKVLRNSYNLTSKLWNMEEI